MEIIAKFAGLVFAGLLMRIVRKLVFLILKIAILAAGLVAFWLWLTHR